LINKSVTLEYLPYDGLAEDHFFKVKMSGIHDSKNVLINVPIIRSYLSEIAPVGFNPNFNYGLTIDSELANHVPFYKKYRLLLNGEPVYKPYNSGVTLSKGMIDEIEGIKFIQLNDDKNVLAFGWIGKLSLLGTINPSTGVDGIRLLCGNILVGNKNILSALFRESRFNHYLVGELHAVDRNLVPNARRDDFEDSTVRSTLFNEFIKQVGIPYSKKIREKSKQRERATLSSNTSYLFEQARTVLNYGFLSLQQRDRILRHLNNVNGSHSKAEVSLAKDLAKQLSETKHIFDTRNISSRSKTEIITLYRETLNQIYPITPGTTSADFVKGLYQIILNT
jgi:hypothetical protein